MTGLALDSSGEVLSAAVRTPDSVFYSEIDAGIHHSERIMEMLDSLMTSARIKPERLEFVACMRGPGSFTGLRIGMATVKGLSVSLAIPLFAVPTFDCIAFTFGFWPGPLFAVIDAKRECWFCAEYFDGKRVGDDADISTEELSFRMRSAAKKGTVFVTGPGATAARPVMEQAGLDNVVIDTSRRGGKARELLAIAEERFQRGESGEIDEVGLHYLRKSEAELTRDAKRKRSV